MNFKKFRQSNHIRQSDIADYLNVGKSYISQVETGRSQLSADKLDLLLHNDRGWDVASLGDEDPSIVPSHRIGIPVISSTAIAAYLSADCSIDDSMYEIYDIPALAGSDFLTTVAGASMSPTLLSGDIIACRRMPSDGIIQWGKIYVVDIGQGQPLIRRIRPGNSSDAIRLTSDTPSYEPIDLPRSGIVSLALVIGFIRVD